MPRWLALLKWSLAGDQAANGWSSCSVLSFFFFFFFRSTETQTVCLAAKAHTSCSLSGHRWVMACVCITSYRREEPVKRQNGNSLSGCYNKHLALRFAHSHHHTPGLCIYSLLIRVSCKDSFLYWLMYWLFEYCKSCFKLKDTFCPRAFNHHILISFTRIRFNRAKPTRSHSGVISKLLRFVLCCKNETSQTLVRIRSTSHQKLGSCKQGN